VIKGIFDAAVQVTSGWALSAFIAAAVVAIIYMSRKKSRNAAVPAMAWIVLCVAVIMPSLGALVLLFVDDPLYRLRVTVLDGDNQSVDNAVISTVPFGVQKKVGSAWEVEIPRAAVGEGQQVEVRAEAQSADGMLIGTAKQTLGSEPNVDVGITLAPPRNARISGIVVDNIGRAVKQAKVSVIGYGAEVVTTDDTGSFDLDAHVARAQPVTLHTEADGFLPDNQTYLAGSRATITLQPNPKTPTGRRR
jgi:hypothetical protein